MVLFVTCHRKPHELDYAWACWNEEKSLKDELHHVHDLFIDNAIIAVQNPGKHNVGEIFNYEMKICGSLIRVV